MRASYVGNGPGLIGIAYTGLRKLDRGWSVNLRGSNLERADLRGSKVSADLADVTCLVLILPMLFSAQKIWQDHF